MKKGFTIQEKNVKASSSIEFTDFAGLHSDRQVAEGAGLTLAG
jgi:hypothetical protein